MSENDVKHEGEITERNAFEQALHDARQQLRESDAFIRTGEGEIDRLRSEIREMKRKRRAR